jgi:hypothetical protein
MKKLLIALAAVLVTAATYGQGTVRFANRDVTAGLDAPITLAGTTHGPGADYTAQLFLVNGTTFTALTPPSTFNASTGTIADKYIKPQDVTVPGVAGGSAATFVVRAWLTASGSFDAAASKGQSAPVTVAALGGAGAPPSLPALLTGLQGFEVTAVPEPTVIALGVLGAAAFMLRRRK